MANAKTLTARLGGDWHGTYGLAPAPGHSPGDRSLGIWDKDGLPFLHSFAGEDWRNIRDTLKDQGLLVDEIPVRTPVRDNFGSQMAKEPDGTGKAHIARKIWLSGQPVTGSLAETYLRSRGLEGPFPDTLRFHAGLRHRPSGQLFPALIASIQVHGQVDPVPGAIHRTFLAPDGLTKAEVDKNKMMLGPCRGGAVRLVPNGDERAKVILTEGIETALTVLEATGLPTWACLSASGMTSVALPPEVKHVVIAADNDTAGLRAADEAARRFDSEGRAVFIACPNIPGEDFNDQLRA